MNFNSYLNLSDGISNPITDWLTAHEKDIIHTADYIFHHPELAYQERNLPDTWLLFWKKTDLKSPGISLESKRHLPQNGGMERP